MTFPRSIVKGANLSPSELRAVKGLLEGKTYKEMGAEFNCAPTTIATHVMRARVKWGVTKATRLSLLLEYLNRREQVLASALDLIGVGFPGRGCGAKEWDEWRAKCRSAHTENERTKRLL